jgi:ClpP class serine protease
MSIPHILTQIINTPLYITPDKLQVIMGILMSRHGADASLDLSGLIAMQGGPVEAAARAEVRPMNEVSEQQIAVISALGSMVNRNHGFGESDGSGLRSYRTLSAEMTAAGRDSEIGGIILDMDSFGGMAAGCDRATRLIADVAKIKPVYAVVDLACFSACYSLASACSRIILTDASAGVGSIGCLALHHDQTQRNEKEGDIYTAVYFGARKNDYSPHAPLDKELLARMQRSVDQFGLKFAQTVSEFRGMDLDKVLATQAGMYFGQDAITAGLADEIASFDDAVGLLSAEIHKKKSPQSKGESAMTTKDRFEALLANEDGPTALAELGYIQQEAAGSTAHAAGYSEGFAAGAEQSRQSMIEVAELAQLAMLDTTATVTLLKQGLDKEAAMTAIQTMRAEASKKTVVLSTVDPLNTNGKHGLIAACEAMNK